jgi:hypothetical protein
MEDHQIYNQTYNQLCDHKRLKRIDRDYVLCLGCGESFVNQKKPPRNVTASEIVSQNQGSLQHYDKYFTDKIEVKEPVRKKASYYYYSDPTGVNNIKVSTKPNFTGVESFYDIWINGVKETMSVSDINKLLSRINCKRVR